MDFFSIILHLNEDKKRTRDWFQVCGIHVPLEGTTFGLICSIAYNDKESNTTLCEFGEIVLNSEFRIVLGRDQL